MTVEEKQEGIKNWCRNESTNCIECPLFGFEGSCYEELDLVERNYDILFGPNKAPDEASYQLKDDISTIREEHERQTDPIKPVYYNDTKITPFDVIDDWGLNFYLGNAVKYIKRAGKKEGNSRLQDLKKIREYIDHEIREEGNVR